MYNIKKIHNLLSWEDLIHHTTTCIPLDNISHIELSGTRVEVYLLSTSWIKILNAQCKTKEDSIKCFNAIIDILNYDYKYKKD